MRARDSALSACVDGVLLRSVAEHGWRQRAQLVHLCAHSGCAKPQPPQFAGAAYCGMSEAHNAFASWRRQQYANICICCSAAWFPYEFACKAVDCLAMWTAQSSRGCRKQEQIVWGSERECGRLMCQSVVAVPDVSKEEQAVK